MTRRDSWRQDDEGLGVVPVGAAARQFMAARGLKSTIVLAEIMTCWAEAVGEVVAAHSKPIAIRARALVVEVDEPAWATEMQFQSAGILNILRDRLGAAAPSELSVTVTRRRRA